MHKLTRVALFVAGTLMASNAVHAQTTSSGIRGQLVDSQGNPLAGVTVEVVHVPTGTKKTVTTTDNGIFQSRGLAVGGPYTVKLMDGSQYQVNRIEDLYLQLGKTANVALTAAAPRQNVEVISVKASPMMAGAMKKGPSAEFNEEDIGALPSISRDLKSVLQRDSKVMVDPTADGGPALSIAGGSVRGNSFTVDGVKLNDDFGLNKNGYPGRRSPISLDAIEQLSVNIAPFDVTYGDFEGGNINVVTKSGTNDFTGTVYYFRSDDSMIGDKSEGQDLAIGDFTEDTYGFSLGGPIVEDKLFFFASYEKFDSSKPYGYTLDNQDGVVGPNEKIGVTQEDFDRIAQIARDVWNYDIGGYNTSQPEEAENTLLKLDWYINDEHRASLTYMSNDGNTVRDFWGDQFPTAPWTTAESNRYNQAEEVEVYSLQFFSDWNEDLSTVVRFTDKETVTKQDPLLGANFGQMLIGTPNGGQLYIGPDQFRHANQLTNQRSTLSVKADYFLTDEHKLTVGFDHEVIDVYNLFVFGSLGFSTFETIEDFENNNTFHVFQNSLDGNPLTAADVFDYEQNTVYIQDEWTATDELTVTYGVRYTRFSNDIKPVLNQNFVDRHGYSNQGNYDGLDLLQPRFGFTYTPNDDLVVRGGIGLFGASGPNVWLSNSYGNDGVRKTFAGCFGDCFNGHETPQEVLDFLAVGGFSGGNGDTNSIHPDFEMPSRWKYNVGFDYRIDLGPLGEDWTIGADVLYNDVKNAIKYRELNLEQVSTAPDGRPIYNTPAPFDMSLENTKAGGGWVVSTFASKIWYSDYGTFSFDGGYTYQDLTEVNPGNSFIAFEGYSMPAHSDFQSEREFNSEYEVKHTLAASLTWSNELFGDNTTSISIGYNGRSGRHYSPTMRTGVENGFGGFVDFASWVGYQSQLLYVPTGVDDPLVSFAEGFDTTGFFDYIDSTSCLASKKGQIVDRHSCESSWIHVFNIRFKQEVEIEGDHTLEVTFDIENVGNLLNDDWGRVEGYVQPFNAPVVDAGFAPVMEGGEVVGYDHSQYIYDKFTEPKPIVKKQASVWKVQLGVRYRF